MSVKMDAVAEQAIDLARAAGQAEAGADQVGAYLGATADGKRLVSHLFECTDPAYRGWRWSITLARSPKARTATVCEVVLVPGEDAIVAPDWLPFGERLRPDDLGVGDVIPSDPDDDRLVPGYTGADDDPADDQLDPWWWEFGLGRARVLSAIGREEAAGRWRAGERGPGAPMAKMAASNCATCGWLLRLHGPLGGSFGVCANEMSPADARVVSMDFGCGAHSESEHITTPEAAAAVLDELDFEVVTLTDSSESSEPTTPDTLAEET